MLDHLPHPIFLEILFRIPVNFLVKCMSVSKTWYSLIKSADFIYSHLESSISRNAKDPHIVRLVQDNNMRECLRFESFESHEPFHKQLTAFIPHDNLLLIGYSNGIFCYADARDEGYFKYLLWNPSIQKYFILPRSNYENHSTAAVVFDSNVNDFKVLAAFGSLEVELFSLRNRSWKIIRGSDSIVFRYEKYIFVEGVIYFMGKEKLTNKYYIGGFNLADEDFHKIMLPESLGSSNYPELIRYGNTSIAVVAHYSKGFILWFMEEISVLGSWKKVVLKKRNYSMMNVFFGVWNGKVLYEKRSGQLISLDLNSLRGKYFGLKRDKTDMVYDSFHRYEETLALLDNGKDVSFLKEENIGIYDDASDSENIYTSDDYASDSENMGTSDDDDVSDSENMGTSDDDDDDGSDSENMGISDDDASDSDDG